MCASFDWAVEAALCAAADAVVPFVPTADKDEQEAISRAAVVAFLLFMAKTQHRDGFQDAWAHTRWLETKGSA